MKIKYTTQSAILLSLAFLNTQGWAVPIGIVDSGTDLQHPDLMHKAWVNPGHLAGDPFQDDTHGWNFADKNNQVIDYKFLGTFSPDTTKFFEVQFKILQDTATEEDRQWMKSKKDDEKFIKELGTFGNFVHGTHVAGISAHSADQALIMAAKILPTKAKEPSGETIPENLMSRFSFKPWESHPLSDYAMNLFIEAVASAQSKELATVGNYLNITGMKVANCSFGTNVSQAKRVVSMIAHKILHRDLSDEEQEKFAIQFMNQVVTQGASFAHSAPDTLFVIAAGNDGTNNDQLPTFPANLKFDNTITVAATRGYDKIASFSNYGAKMVDIAAPGVGIVSDIPGGGTMPLSGTSQAAPFITNLAGRILDTNPKLTLPEVKQVLLQTVDKKPFLVGKVLAEGIANPERALRAATLSTQLSLKDAIEQSNREVSGVKSIFSVGSADGYDGEPIPMPSLF